MNPPLRVTPLGKEDEKRFLDFLEKDRAQHIFTIYDFSHLRERTEVCVAFKNDEVGGYLLEFDKRIVHTHGDEESVAQLLRFVDFDEPVFIIKPHHREIVEKFFKPVKPTDPSSKSTITTYLVMEADADTFKPIIQHPVKRLGTEDLDEVSKSLGDDYRKRVETAIQRGLAFAAYDGGSLASVATVSEIVGNLALIRGVYTSPSFRGRGLATSVCSALVAELIRLGKEAMLWVAKENLQARRVYEKIGFKETGHVLLGFRARRL